MAPGHAPLPTPADQPQLSAVDDGTEPFATNPNVVLPPAGTLPL